MAIHLEYLDNPDVAFRLVYDKQVSDRVMKAIVTRAFLSKEEIKALALTGNVELSTRKTYMVDGVVGYYHQVSEIVSTQTTDIYARADSKQKREALEKAYVNLVPDKASHCEWEKNQNLLGWLKSLQR